MIWDQEKWKKECRGKTAQPENTGEKEGGFEAAGHTPAARKKALQLLEFKDRTEKELSERLFRDGFSREETEDAIAWVRSFGYLSDRRYAENHILSGLNRKSRQKLFMELLQKGIDRETIELAWEEVSEDQEFDEKQLIEKEILKKYAEDSIISEKEMRRLQGYLARRGFGFEDISAALARLHIEMDRRRTQGMEE